MRAVAVRVKTNCPHPRFQDSAVLPCGEVGGRGDSAWEQEVVGAEPRFRHPGADRVPRLFSDLELHRTLCLMLHDDRARANPTALDNVPNPERHQVAAAQFAVDPKVEQGEITGAMFQL